MRRFHTDSHGGQCYLEFSEDGAMVSVINTFSHFSVKRYFVSKTVKCIWRTLYYLFGGPCNHATRSSDALVPFDITTRCHKPRDRSLNCSVVSEPLKASVLIFCENEYKDSRQRLCGIEEWGRNNDIKIYFCENELFELQGFDKQGIYLESFLLLGIFVVNTRKSEQLIVTCKRSERTKHITSNNLKRLLIILFC
jgi:hypothetical protein